ncbi:MAG: DUF4159 domain-containing protein [Gemmatimonadota bacterium]|nr:DUF4159 domain-containing protein [Gemmatimonadota bacterium]
MTRAGATAMDVLARRFTSGRAALIALGLAAGTATLTVSGLPPQRAAPALASPPAGNTVLSAHTTLPGPATFQGLPTVPYDGTYTFVRVRFNSQGRGFSRGFGGGRNPGWAHDYPNADENFTRILDEVTLIDVNNDGTNVIDAEDPELHRYPIAYVSEPGEWSPTQQEIDNLSDYLFKGGFLILDDFRSDFEWRTVEEIFRMIAPGHRFRVLNIDEPIFDSFFDIATLDMIPPTFQQFVPVFLGLHENNDPTARLMVIANFNNDIGDYWEYSDRGYVPIELSNEAYKFGVNYVIYAMNR